MATLAVQLTIGDYAKWRPVFDKHKPLRDKADIKKFAYIATQTTRKKSSFGGKPATRPKPAQPWEAMKSKMR